MDFIQVYHKYEGYTTIINVTRDYLNEDSKTV
jgi:hypothetical protein